MALCAENEEELKTLPLKSVVLSLLDVPVYRPRIKEAVYLLAEVRTAMKLDSNCSRDIAMTMTPNEVTGAARLYRAAPG